MFLGLEALLAAKGVLSHFEDIRILVYLFCILDASNAAELGICQEPEFDYMEVRIAAQQWESATFEVRAKCGVLIWLYLAQSISTLYFPYYCEELDDANR